MKNSIRPTHTCFDDALDLLSARLRKNPELADAGLFVVVHAICLIPDGPEKDKRFAHAWLEEGGATAWQGGILDGQLIAYAVDARELEAELRMEKAWRYTPREVAAENGKHVTYGPWKPELLELCRKKKNT